MSVQLDSHSRPAPLDYSGGTPRRPPNAFKIFFAGPCLALGMGLTGLALPILVIDDDLCAVGVVAVGGLLSAAGFWLQVDVRRLAAPLSPAQRLARVVAYAPPLLLIAAAFVMPDRTRTGSSELTAREGVIGTTIFWLMGITMWHVVRWLRRILAAARTSVTTSSETERPSPAHASHG